jgi:hypothetical protein
LRQPMIRLYSVPEDTFKNDEEVDEEIEGADEE